MARCTLLFLMFLLFAILPLANGATLQAHLGAQRKL